MEATSTYLLDLKVRNVRCFGPEEQTLRLSDSEGRPALWTVILGDNGVGKTTLLQCLVALEPRRHLLNRFSEERAPTEQRPLVDLPTELDGGWRIYRDLDHPGETSIRGSFAIQGLFTDGPWPIVVPTISGGDLRSDMLRNFDVPRQLSRFRCHGYGANRRMGSAALSRGPEDPSASLFLDSVTLVEAEEWLLAEDYRKLRSRESPELRQRFESVKKVLLGLLPDAEDFRITESASLLSKPTIQVRTPYGWVALSDLSIGYRTMIAWTVDLASRLFEMHPESKNPLAEPAVVLVDEVDLHLHPRWQRVLRSYLMERFPRTQFVVTAHSPLIVQASENENIVVLRREGDHVVIDNDVESVHGWRVDQVLTSDLFGLKTARPLDYDKLIVQRNEILAKVSRNPHDQEILKHLESRIAKLPAGETPEDAEAMDVIRRAAAALKER